MRATAAAPTRGAAGRHRGATGNHIRPWSEGGETSLANGVLLCTMHHRLIHHSDWEVFIGDDRHPWFVPPVDPHRPKRERTAIRSHARRTLTAYPTADAA
ncbi:HNH endonuclease [Gordonia sp. HY002]|uniref:HNH endonuclease signature motif containing protein n=1 Tax=Gordonia zhenghanii TaxID=2911516 RepID=UPI001EF12AAB|nr:HNH endonuclease signature motif containing protein [Gordonia zhenghanii]MCF8570730.1 HNH endonuclease [Gordonia zhenghanii]MCF8605688.1 HNH endonuclease [Gordonia zhenghanii]